MRTTSVLMFHRLRPWALIASVWLGLFSNPVFAQTVGEKAKLNNIVTFDGAQFDPKVLDGKPTLLYFWASWCPICRREMVELEKHYQAYKDKGFNVLAVNFRDEEPKARAMIESVKPISYTVGSINDEWKRDYPTLRATPTWYLLDKNGVIRKVIVGQEIISGGWFDGLVGELKKVTAE